MPTKSTPAKNPTPGNSAANSARRYKSAAPLVARAKQQDGGDLASIADVLTDAVRACSAVRARVAALRSEAQVADMLDGGETPGAYERVFQTLGAMDREVGNAESSIRNIIGIQRQLDAVMADLDAPADDAPPEDAPA